MREFWQRWHISLSSWLRDYLYISLGGNRGSESRVARNLMLTMLLGGLWHGANWTFILWGFLHGSALVVHRAVTRKFALSALDTPLGRVVSTFLTFAWVAFCFTIFRCADINAAWRLFTAPTNKAESFMLSPVWWLILVLLGGVHFVVRNYRPSWVALAQQVPDRVFYPALGAACTVLLYLTPLNLTPFIYFQF